MENKTKWYEILEASGALNINKVIENGNIQYVDLLEDRTIWHLHILLDEVVSCETIFLIMDKVTKYLYSVTDVRLVRFSWHYSNPNFAPEFVEEYLLKGIIVMTTRNKSALVLSKYSKSYDINKIIFYVASESDKQMVVENMNLLKPFLIDFGFDKLEYQVIISKTEIDYVDLKEKEKNIHDQQADLRAYEKQVKDIEIRRFEKDKKQNKERRSGIAIKMEIENLPSTSMAVQEFRQKNATDQVIFEGVLVKKEIRQVGKYTLFTGLVTNYKDSISIKHFISDYDKKFYTQDLIEKMKISCKGSIQYDTYSNDVVVMCREIATLGMDDHEIRIDAAQVKRVELHAHTKMSTLDSVMDVDAYVNIAKSFGHKAIAVTDHANCHVLPDFFSACKKAGIKPIAGVEGNFVDDYHYAIALTDEDIDLHEATFVVFDIETTGFSINYNEIIEIGAVKIYKGMPVDEFSAFVKPKDIISKVITDLTGITNDDVVDAETIEEVLPKFVEFIKGSILVAHNATFDTEFIYHNMKKLGLFEKRYPCIDTLQLAKAMYSQILKRFNLKDVAKGLKVEVEEQHRALSDSHTTTNAFMRMLGDLSDKGIINYNQINSIVNKEEAFKYVIPSHINILVKTHEGLKNFYKIISDSHTIHFHKEARILKSVIDKYRDGLLIGSGCVNGEIFKAAHEGSLEKLESKMSYYDYIEVQPPQCYEHLIELSGTPITKEHIKTTIKLIVDTAYRLGKIVIATGDVHQINPEDSIYRKIYTSVARPGGGLHELARVNEIPKMYYRTTSEMIDSFNFLPERVAYEIVVTNTNMINDMIEEYNLFPKKLFVPRDDFMDKYGVPSMKDAVKNISYETANKMYGNPLPKYVEHRLNKELQSIIGNGFSSVYYISHMLVKNSNQNGYVVGSRGSVGSSFVATMMNITEVNPLKPHYVCKNCKYSAFKGIEEEKIPQNIIDNLNAVQTGYDLPECTCPMCGSVMSGEGIDIPFETFLGFHGDKVPDIDLNFSGEYQDKAHLFCREVFGMDNAFRAGTISTVAEKNAYGFVKNFFEERNITIREAEIKRIADAIINSKRTTGQHPGGIVVVPDDIEYTDIVPVQYPADDVNSAWRTTHYDYHSFESNLLKLDILGHDDPTVIKKLMDYVALYPEEFPFSTVQDIPFLDQKVISIFASKDALGLKGEEVDTLVSGTKGIPEFGTNYVREILNDIGPKTFADLVSISGLSHGTNVWLGNAKDLLFAFSMTPEPIPFSKLICCRDDIMVDLLNYGLDDADAFSIMEHVRKGKGLTEKEREILTAHNVPEWYQLSCQKIEYMFPKAHATAYVIMALRIAWFKVHRPIYYYSAYFSCRASAFDAEVLAAGRNAIRNKINEINEKIASKTATNKEKDLLNELHIALEMYLRGYTIKQVDIQKSDATTFVISEDKKSLILPFATIDNLGEAAAYSVIEARNEHPFESKKDVERRTKLNKTTYNRLLRLGALDSLPDDDMKSLL